MAMFVNELRRAALLAAVGSLALGTMTRLAAATGRCSEGGTAWP